MADTALAVRERAYAGQQLTVGEDHAAAEADATRHEQIRTKLALARRQFQTAITAETRLRKDQLDDLRFVASEQWRQADVTDRALDNRPCLTINRLPQFIRQVTNAARAAKPAIQINPVGNGADVATAEVLQGICRNIENQSDAQVAYSTAAEAQARIGRGYWRVVLEHVDDTTFALELRIKRVRNPFTIVMDPACDELDSADARYCFVVEDIPKDEFKARFGEAAMTSLEEVMVGNDRAPDWMPEGKVRIAEWWYVDSTPSELYEVQWPDEPQPDGTMRSGQRSTVEAETFAQWPQDAKDRVRIRRRRRIQQKRVKMALISGAEILEGNDDKTDGADWHGTIIPIVPVIGEEIDLNGVLDYRGMVRDAKDPQRLYNYENTALAETLSLAPKSPFIGYVGQFDGQEAQWKLANRRAFPFLQVNPLMANGAPAPFPQRNNYEPPILAITRAIAQADNDLKATTGLFDPSLGRNQNQSGKAIAALQRQGEMANSNFLDNLARAVRQTGRILIELIPKVYTEATLLRISGKDGKDKHIMVHAKGPMDAAAAQEAGLPSNAEAEAQGLDGIYDLSVGKYDVTVSVGTSQETKRQEALTGLTAIVQANPGAFQVIGDLIVENMDWPGAQEAAARLKKTLPPQLQADAPEGQVPPQIQQQLQQQGQQVAQMGQQFQQAQTEIASLRQQVASKEMQLSAEFTMKQMELASRERIAQLEAESRLLELKLKHGQGLSSAKFQADADVIAKSLDLQHAHALSQQEHDQQVTADALAHLRAQVAAGAPSGPTAPTGPVAPPGPVPSGPPTA